MNHKLKLLIIGGSGSVSGHLVKKALTYRHEVWVLTRGNKPVPAGVIVLKIDRSDRPAFKKVLTLYNLFCNIYKISSNLLW